VLAASHDRHCGRMVFLRKVWELVNASGTSGAAIVRKYSLGPHLSENLALRSRNDSARTTIATNRFLSFSLVLERKEEPV